MTLVQLEYIVALDTLKHFAKAAAHCHITQPSLSMQVQKLEEELGVQLFLRTNPVTTTATGQIVLQQARKILAEAGMMQQLVQQGVGLLSLVGVRHMGAGLQTRAVFGVFFTVAGSVPGPTGQRVLLHERE